MPASSPRLHPSSQGKRQAVLGDCDDGVRQTPGEGDPGVVPSLGRAERSGRGDGRGQKRRTTLTSGQRYGTYDCNKQATGERRRRKPRTGGRKLVEHEFGADGRSRHRASEDAAASGDHPARADGRAQARGRAEHRCTAKQTIRHARLVLVSTTHHLAVARAACSISFTNRVA
jgi:hypothetical protein